MNHVVSEVELHFVKREIREGDLLRVDRVSFLTDDIIRLRYVSIDGQLRKIMVVIKMRGGNHAKDIREYEITSKGVVILGKRLTNFQGLISGVPVHSNRSDLKEEPAQEPEIGSKG